MPRTDSDTWDLATSVGATATAVAAGRALASQGPDALLDDPWADPLVRAVGHEHFIKLIDGQILLDDDPVLNRRAMNEQMAVRTRYFDDFFRESTGAADGSGIRQAVILAAGLDTRAYRLNWPAGTKVFEVDQPEVIEFKTRTLRALGATPSSDRRTVAVDLRNDWPAALRAAGFDAAAPTAWIAEGLLVYLPPEAQDRLFDNITALSAAGSRIATEHMDLDAMPADWAEKLDERSRRAGSDLSLADLFYSGERHSAGAYLSGQGWQVDVLSTREAFAGNGFELPDDELAAYMGADSGYLSAVLR
ncbi:class I SAM-dependent methyltransferase [soil metagenome]